MTNIEKFTNIELISELYRRFCTNSVHISTSVNGLTINEHVAPLTVHNVQPVKADLDLDEFKKIWRNLDGTEWPEPD